MISKVQQRTQIGMWSRDSVHSRHTSNDPNNQIEQSQPWGNVVQNCLDIREVWRPATHPFKVDLEPINKKYLINILTTPPPPPLPDPELAARLT